LTVNAVIFHNFDFSRFSQRRRNSTEGCLRVTLLIESSLRHLLQPQQKR